MLEVYPVAPSIPERQAMGFVPLFEGLGFTYLGKVGTRRHIMRLNFS